MLSNNIILNKLKEKEKEKINNYTIDVNFIFPEIGCNANCSYCLQKGKYKINQNIDIIPLLKSSVNKILDLAKKENRIVNILLMGGELKILSDDKQIEIVDFFRKIRETESNVNRIVLFVNDTKLDSPIMNMEFAQYNIHAINWKNKKLPKLSRNKFYNVIITDDITKKDIEFFLKLNTENEIIFRFDTFSKADKKVQDEMIEFLDKEKTFNKNLGRKIAFDRKQRMYLCRNKDNKNYSINFSNGKGILDYCCNGHMTIPLDDLKTLEFPNIKCPKDCISHFF